MKAEPETKTGDIHCKTGKGKHNSKENIKPNKTLIVISAIWVINYVPEHNIITLIKIYPRCYVDPGHMGHVRLRGHFDRRNCYMKVYIDLHVIPTIKATNGKICLTAEQPSFNFLLVKKAAIGAQKQPSKNQTK